MKQRLGIAQALFGNPKLLICDEPTSALDPAGRREILELLHSLKERTTVLFSTHILSDVERICDECAVLHKGKLVASFLKAPQVPKVLSPSPFPPSSKYRKFPRTKADILPVSKTRKTPEHPADTQ